MRQYELKECVSVVINALRGFERNCTGVGEVQLRGCWVYRWLSLIDQQFEMFVVC